MVSAWFKMAPVAAAALALTSASACKKTERRERGEATGQENGATGQAKPAPPPVSKRPAGDYGLVRGTVSLTGDAPPMPAIQNGTDPICAQTKLTAETILVNDNATLQNALVRVKPGTVTAWTPSTPVQIKQVDCMYRPRVQGGVAGQALEVFNTDDTAHNVHARGGQIGDRQGADALWNRQQLKVSRSAAPLAAVIENIPVMRIKCDLHGWMSGYVVVSDNPYNAVTGKTGGFEFEAPVGELTIEAWHEFYGLKQAKVVVEKGKTAEVSFQFDANADNPTRAKTAPAPAPAPAPSKGG